MCMPISSSNTQSDMQTRVHWGSSQLVTAVFLIAWFKSCKSRDRNLWPYFALFTGLLAAHTNDSLRMKMCTKLQSLESVHQNWIFQIPHNAFPTGVHRHMRKHTNKLTHTRLGIQIGYSVTWTRKNGQYSSWNRSKGLFVSHKMIDRWFQPLPALLGLFSISSDFRQVY